jgi:hypothetical protein
MRKNVKLVLCEVNNQFSKDVYEVKKLVNTTKYSIGEHIDKMLVEDMIKRHNHYTVEIVKS